MLHERAVASKAKQVHGFDLHSIVEHRGGRAVSGLMKSILEALELLIIVLLSYGGIVSREVT